MAVAGRKPEQIPEETRLHLAQVRADALQLSRQQLDSVTQGKEPLESVAFLAGYEAGAKGLDDSVVKARRSGLSWAAIAEALGDTEPGASRRTKNRFHKRLADRLQF